jgi:hypothetical protein
MDAVIAASFALRRLSMILLTVFAGYLEFPRTTR